MHKGNKQAQGVFQNGGVERVDDVLATPLGPDEPRLLEHREVVGQGSGREGEMLPDLPRRERASAKKIKDASPTGIGQSTKDV